MFNFFQGVPAPPFVHPAAFSGIYSEDDFVNHTAQRAPHGFPFAHARVHPFGRQRGYHHYHHHPHHHRHHRRHPGGPYGGSFSPASLGNLWNGFGPAYSGSHPPFFSPNHRGAAFSPEELAYSFLQQDGRQRAHDRRLEAIARQSELAREREAQRQRAIAEAVAREQQARAAREAHARAANAARAHARQSRDEEVLLALLAQLGLAVASVQSAVDASQANTEPPSVQLTPPAAPAAPASAPSEPPMPTDRKGKGKAVDVPVEVTASTSTPAHAPAPAKTPSLKEELEARIRTETDPDVQESLVLLYSDIYDARAPAQPVAGPSGHKLEHVSFQVPISGPSPAPIQAEEAIDTDTTVPSYPTTTIADAAEEHDGASPDPSLAQIKDVEDTLRQLEGAFEFPAQLDFVDRVPSPSPSSSPSLAHPESESEAGTETAELAYTANNTPVHAYEHALNGLLTRLDAVESHGDVEVRGRRREVVKEVERALEAMERRIEESRERSRERARARRGSVSSQVSDASVTVTPYNVHSEDNVDDVEVAVVVEEVPIEVLAEVEEPEAASDVEDASVVAEDTALQVKVVEDVPAATNENSEATLALPLVDNAEPEHSPLAIGIPDSGADTTAPSLSHPPIFSDPSSPVDEDEESLDGAFDAFSPPSDASASQVVTPAIETLAEPSPDFNAEVMEQEVVGMASQDVQSQSEAVSEPQSPPEPAEESKIVPSSTQPAVVASEAISRVESTATDATFVTADAAPLSATDDATIFTAPGPSEPEPTQPLAPAPTVPTPGSSASTSSAGEEAFLLSSTPLAHPDNSGQCRMAEDDSDELEIIGKEELEAARDDSDWSDVESESDLEIVL